MRWTAANSCWVNSSNSPLSDHNRQLMPEPTMVPMPTTSTMQVMRRERMENLRSQVIRFMCRHSSIS